jgi:hypothetical protein
MFVEPQASDPEVIARKIAVNPKVRIPPRMEWVTDDDGRILNYKLEGETLFTKIRDLYAALFYNSIVTHIPFHFIRLGYLRLCGATIGKGSAINRGTSVWSIRYIVIGDDVAIGFRCLLDARAGIAIGNDVVIASDTQIIAGGHQPPELRAGAQSARSHRDRRLRMDRQPGDDLAQPDRTGRGRRRTRGGDQGGPPARDRRRSPREGRRQTKRGRTAIQRQVQNPLLLTPEVAARNTV